MRITHVCPTYDTNFAHWHEKIAQCQYESGHEVNVLTSTLLPNGSGTGHTPGRMTESGVNVRRFPATTLKHQIIPLVDPRELRTNADILHLHSYGQIFPEITALVNRDRPILLKADVGAAYPDRNPLKRLERRLVDAVTAFDSDEVSYLVEMGFNPCDIHKVPHGVEFTRFNNAGTKLDSVEGRLIIVAQVIPEKNIELAIRSVRSMLDHNIESAADIHLRIVGPIVDEEYHEHLLTLAERLEVADRIEFVGLVPHHRIHEEFAKGSVVLVTSRSESGGPASMVEGAATGRPVISVPLSLASELDSGVISVGYRPDQIAEECAALLEDGEVWQKYANAAAEAVKPRDWTQIVNQLDEIYREISS